MGASSEIAESILDEIECYVVSCGDTVTYKSISQKWNVHVNTAKQLLCSFLDKQKSKENPVDFEVIYFLSGPLKNADEGKSYQVCLVREKDVEKIKSQLKKVVSEHVYSIQKSTLKDLHALYIVDKANGGNILQGKSGKSSVNCEDAVPRTGDSLVQATTSTARDKENETLEKNTQKSLTETSKVDANVKKSSVNGGVPSNIGKGKKDVPKGIAGMFVAQGAKASSKKSETDSEHVNSKSSEVKKPLGKKPNGIASLFAKQALHLPPTKIKKEEPKKEPKNVIVAEEEDPFASEDEEVVQKGLLTNEDVSDEERSRSPVEPKAKPKEKKAKATKERRKKRSSHSDGEEESPLANKKRRRIKMMSSSEGSSEEEMEVGESESPLPPTKKSVTDEVVSENDDIIPATPQQALDAAGGKKRIRKRVLVNKTFEDEQGFIVTKKKYVFESCTDDSSQSGEEGKSVKEKVVTNGELNEKEDNGSKKTASPDNDKNSTNSPGDESNESKGKKGKDTAKGKKPVGKKALPPIGRQGVLTSFFKRS